MSKLNFNNLWTRIASGLFMLIIFLSIMLFHKGFLLILILLFTNVAFLEVMFVNKNQKSFWYIVLSLLLFIWITSSGILNLVLSPSFPKDISISFKVIEPLKITILFLIMSAVPIFSKKVSFKTTSIHTTILILLVMTARSTMWLLFKSADYGYGFEILLLIFMIIFSCDIGGYFFGNWLGKHKISPIISPKKTWEGFFGGILLSYIAVYLWKVLFFVPFAYDDPAKTMVFIIITTLIFCLSSLFGDLYFSLLKRTYKINDFSRIIPGHGGALDRLDSITFAMIIAKLIYAYFL